MTAIPRRTLKRLMTEARPGAPREREARGFLGWGRRGTIGAVIASELTFENVSQSYGDVTAVRDVSFSARAGEVICLLGPSGCGKTTLLRLAAGVEAPLAGRILLDRQEVSSTARLVPPEERGVGLMFQEYALFPHLSILDNVRFGLKRLDPKAAIAQAARALARVGLSEQAAKFPHMLSGGQQQRAALARALAPRPGILLMDEPFSNLDGRTREEVREGTIALLAEARATAVIVTHDAVEAMQVADRIILMRDGGVVQSGDARTLYNAPADLFAARFFCDVNEVPGRVRNGAVVTALGSFAAPKGLAEGTEAVVCLRPHGLRLGAAGTQEAGSVACRILRRRFLGETDLVEVALEGVDQPFRVRHSLGQDRHAPAPGQGQDAGLSWNVDDVLVFAASGA